MNLISYFLITKKYDDVPMIVLRQDTSIINTIEAKLKFNQ